MILSANRDHDLPDMLVALKIAMRLDNIFKRKCLVDYGFQRTVGETLQHKNCHLARFSATNNVSKTLVNFTVANFVKLLIGSIMAGDMSSTP